MMHDAVCLIMMMMHDHDHEHEKEHEGQLRVFGTCVIDYNTQLACETIRQHNSGLEDLSAVCHHTTFAKVRCPIMEAVFPKSGNSACPFWNPCTEKLCYKRLHN